jgi:hypothetical protein
MDNKNNIISYYHRDNHLKILLDFRKWKINVLFLLEKWGKTNIRNYHLELKFMKIIHIIYAEIIILLYISSFIIFLLFLIELFGWMFLWNKFFIFLLYFKFWVIP